MTIGIAQLHNRADLHDHLGFGRQGRKVQLSAAPSAIATIPISGRARLMCATSLASCAFSVSLPLSGMRPRPVRIRSTDSEAMLNESWPTR